MNIFIAQACTNLRPDSCVSVEGSNLSTIIWSDNVTDFPSNNEILEEAERLQAEYDNNQYQRDRNYAPTGDQLDMLWHSIDAGEFGDTAKQSEFYIANKAVKDAFPKG